MSKLRTRADRRRKRHFRVRSKISGTEQVPRVSVCKSLKNTVVQAIDDINGVTIAFASTHKLKAMTKMDGAIEVGRILGANLKGKGIEAVVFDRGGYIYHGRVKVVAESIREQGIKF